MTKFKNVNIWESMFKLFDYWGKKRLNLKYLGTKSPGFFFFFFFRSGLGTNYHI